MKRKTQNNKMSNDNNLMIILMIICALLSLTTLGIVAYDKFIKTNEVTCK